MQDLSGGWGARASGLSHLTYETTGTFTFHQLDQPPFPCGFNLCLRRLHVKRQKKAHSVKNRQAQNESRGLKIPPNLQYLSVYFYALWLSISPSNREVHCLSPAMQPLFVAPDPHLR